MGSSTRKREQEDPAWGFAVAGMFLFWAVILVWAASYWRLYGAWRTSDLVLACSLAVIAVLGAVTEVGELNKTRDLTWVGAGAAFVVPTVGLFVVDQLVTLHSPWRGTVRGLVVGFALLAGLMIIGGIGKTAQQRRRAGPGGLRQGQFLKTAGAVLALLSSAATVAATVASLVGGKGR